MVLDNRGPVCQKLRSANIWNPGEIGLPVRDHVISLLINCNVDHGLCEEDAHLEEVGLAVGPGEGCVQVARQPVPVRGY